MNGLASEIGSSRGGDACTDPRLVLAIDNCFCSKRWTRPCDWMPLIRDLGLTHVEASADTECDPLYMGGDYVRDWIREVREGTEATDVRVVNLYSGHGTYATLGLAHTDARVRARFRDEWMMPQASTAAQLGAGLGFFAHAIAEPVLQDPQAYGRVMDTLYDDLARIAAHATAAGCSSAGVEQMYTPHQPPWTLSGAERLLREVAARGDAPFYLTLDLGHMNGQRHFLQPSPEQVLEWIERTAAGDACGRIWLGPDKARRLFLEATTGTRTPREALAGIREAWQTSGHLFALPEDGDVHAWLRRFGAASPIIHLQQSDGTSSPHWPFSETYNRVGIIRGDEVLESLAVAYRQTQAEGMPPSCGEICLTLEPFIGTAGDTDGALAQIAESVRYWRQFVPEDGIRLSEALARRRAGMEGHS